MTLFNFTTDTNISNWEIVDDLVMGGRSNGQFNLDENGHGQFYGAISLENNGGFSSLHYNFETIDSKPYSKFTLRLKGDSKSYQFRVKDNRNNRYSYIYKFTTSSEWETIEIPFSDMYPSFRGNTLDIPNYNGHQMEEIAFLIGNKKNENFKLKIDKITLE
jgi:hypothetical protein